jgi:RNAse (barnase) inhibitor barstar
MKADAKKIILDGTKWRSVDDFYDAFFKAVGAPMWHGRNFNALKDSIVTGQINQVELPYTITITGLEEMSAEARAEVNDFYDLIKKFRSEGIDVDVTCEP